MGLLLVKINTLPRRLQFVSLQTTEERQTSQQRCHQQSSDLQTEEILRKGLPDTFFIAESHNFYWCGEQLVHFVAKPLPQVC